MFLIIYVVELIPRNEWQNINGLQYYFSRKPTHWSNARRHCRANLGDLAVPTNFEMNNKIYQVIKQLGVPTVWIGVFRGNHGRFFTVNGINILYVNWYPGEPNNLYKKENCVELMNVLQWKVDVGAAGRWNDAPCKFSNRYYVCERSVATNLCKGQ